MRNLFVKKRYLQRYLSKTLINSSIIDVDKVIHQRFGNKIPQLISYLSFYKTNDFRPATGGKPQCGFTQNCKPSLSTYVNIKPLRKYKSRQCRPPVRLLGVETTCRGERGDNKLFYRQKNYLYKEEKRCYGRRLSLLALPIVVVPPNGITKEDSNLSFMQTKFKENVIKYLCVNRLGSQKFYKKDRHLKKLHNIYAFLVRYPLILTKIPFFPYLLPTHYATKTVILFNRINSISIFPNKLYNRNFFTQENNVFKKVTLSVRSLTVNLKSRKPSLVSTLECKPFRKKKYVISQNFFVFNFWLIRPLFFITRLDTFYIAEMLKLPIYPDISNLNLRFLRNRLRKQILPAIRVLLNPQCDAVLSTYSESSSQNKI